ncbi:MAG: hypothetical protein E6I38_06450 [Chloroflexi bacterium]|nr:MAG: hypothetical protein E6I38_06450 [Chloroflexota bacterium]
MSELFGLSMNIIMYVLLAIFGVCIATVGFIFLTNRVMFKMGLRNIPRRGLQTGLIILGLMLATLIITAAFTTGDTIDHSISSKAYDHWQRTDLNVNLRGDDSEDAIGPDVYVDQNVASKLQQQFANDPDIEAFMPFLYARAAATSYVSNLSEASLNLVGVDPERLGRVGGLRLVDGDRFDLSSLQPAQVLVSQRAANDLDIHNGELLQMFIRGHQRDALVAGIVKDEQASGDLGNFDDSTRAGGLVMTLPTVQELTRHENAVNYISIALKGDVHSTVGRRPDHRSREGQKRGRSGRGGVREHLHDVLPDCWNVLDCRRHHAHLHDLRNACGGAETRDGNGAGGRGSAQQPGPVICLGGDVVQPHRRSRGRCPRSRSRTPSNRRLSAAESR